MVHIWVVHYCGVIPMEKGIFHDSPCNQFSFRAVVSHKEGCIINVPGAPSKWGAGTLICKHNPCWKSHSVCYPDLPVALCCTSIHIWTMLFDHEGASRLHVDQLVPVAMSEDRSVFGGADVNTRTEDLNKEEIEDEVSHHDHCRCKGCDFPNHYEN